jgi:hypothetical protein
MPVQFISNNIIPISIAFFSGAMLLWSLFGNRFRGIKEVDTTAALQLINHKNAVVLDVREQSEYDSPWENLKSAWANWKNKKTSLLWWCAAAAIVPLRLVPC